MLCRETTHECVEMIRPYLYSYTPDGPRKQVDLDTTSIDSNYIILLDSYFELVTYHGGGIHQLRLLLELCLIFRRIAQRSKHGTPGC